MRVIFLTHNYPRYQGDLPGSFLHPLAVALRDAGHDVRVVAPSDRGQGGREPLDGVPVRRVRYAAPEREVLAYTGRMQDEVRSASGLMALRGLIKGMGEGAMAEAEGSDGDAVVHAQWWIPAGLAAPRGLPLVLTLHGTDGRLLKKSTAARWLARAVLRRADVVTAVSRHLADVVEETTGREDVTGHVQPMPIESAGRPWSTGGAGAVVVCRLTAQKRVDLAVKAAAELRPPIPLTVIGDGPERPALEALAAALPDTRVSFAGQLPPADVAGRLASADVMVFPAIDEGLGLSAVEALMAGVPVVVASDGGGVVEAVRAHGGGVVTAPTPEALAAGVREALSPTVRAAARGAGERWRKELAPSRVAQKFEAWYREAMSMTNGTRP
jgi:glycosyltransferase involved in cell wall biosynthesis